MIRAMLKHMLKHPGQAMLRGIDTYVTHERTYAESWLRTREIATFRNARAHIRISALGISGTCAKAGCAS